MGTHPKNPGKIYGREKHPELLGDAIKFSPPFPSYKKDASGGEGHVPFLFKILICKQGAHTITAINLHRRSWCFGLM